MTRITSLTARSTYICAGWAAPLLLSALIGSAPAAEAQTLAAPTAQTLTLPTPASNTAAAASDYVLSPDDQIEISVLGHTDYSASAVTILPDGTINAPILGKVHAAGQTIDGLTKMIVHGLSTQLNQPRVTVYLRQSRVRRVNVVGNGAKASGQVEFKTGMHLLDLIATVGGLAAEPQLVQATLMTKDGVQTPIDMVALITGADTTQNMPLAPGDTLFLTGRNPEIAQVQVVGEVTKPGAYSIMPDGVSVLALLNDAGGPLPTAKLTEAQVMHKGQVETVNLRPLLTTDLSSQAGKIRILPGDVLLVPKNQDRVLALGEVKTPGVIQIPDDQPLSLTTAFALVGGATTDGDKKKVNIVRRNPAGPPIMMAFNMEDMLKGKNGVTDIMLQPGDIMFIQTRNRPKSLGDILSSAGSLAFLLNTAAVVGL